MFYIPHLVYKTLEEEKVKNLLKGLSRFQLNKETRGDGVKALAEYVVETFGDNDTWSMKIFFAHSLYLINVIGQIFFTDCFLGYHFTKYGISATSFVEGHEEGRTDPMSKIFPRGIIVGFCTFIFS